MAAMTPPAAAGASTESLPATDAHSRRAAAVMALSLPCDVVLYLLLPMFTADFGVSLAEAGVLLAANRLVRIAGYGWVVRFYARRGDRFTSTLAAAAATVCALGYATLSGFWLLVPLRLLWGLSFAALNLSTQTMATADPRGVARRNGRSRSVIAIGPVLALPLGALMAEQWGPRAIFFVLALAGLASTAVARGLPDQPHPMPARSRRLRRPDSLDTWSFLEGFTLDGLFIIGLSYLGKDMMPSGSIVIAGVVLAARYMGEIVLSPMGGRMAERFGPVRLLVWLSMLTAAALVGFGAGWLWACAALLVILRALQLPLLPPIVALRAPGAGRVQALAAQAVWRDIGAGTGPLLAGLILPLAAPIWIYSVPALLLALAALACRRPGR
jgi:predicted MFS family arabinose efflux permease